MNNKRLLVLSSPSGGGKTTVAKHLLSTFTNLRFSISATTRSKRPNEIDGKDYFYLSKEEFNEKVKNDELVEYEEIFGNYYGTLKSEISNSINSSFNLIFDVDVKGALSIKRAFPEESLLIFLSPPNKETLAKRLKGRETETENQINTRLQRAEMELSQADKFDFIIINDNLEQTLAKAEAITKEYLAL
jgi:guanylate kinase